MTVRVSGADVPVALPGFTASFASPISRVPKLGAVIIQVAVPGPA